MKSINLEVGTRIYYTGDTANDEGFGTIIIVKQKSNFGTILKIKMDDDREFNISPANFSPEYKGSGLTRFVTEAAYKSWKEIQIKQLTDRLKIL